MDRNISLSTAYFVLDDEKYQPALRPPPGLYPPAKQLLAQSYQNLQPSSYQSIYQPVQPVQLNTKMTQIIEKYTPYELTKELDKKKKLEHDLVVAKEIVSLLEKELEKLNDQIEIEMAINKLRATQIQAQVIPVEDTTDVDISKPTDKFIQAVHTLFMKESPIMLSNIPHKLPQDVLPPKGNHGLFTKWIEQVPGCQKQVIPNSNSSKKQFMYWIDYNNTTVETKTSKEKVCFQKKRGKPCNLNDKGKCKYCK
jgi:hypothetical protein